LIVYNIYNYSNNIVRWVH